MSPAEFRAARLAMGMSISELADWLGLEGNSARDSIRQMESGKKAISGPIRRALKLGLDIQHRRSPEVVEELKWLIEDYISVSDVVEHDRGWGQESRDSLKRDQARARRVAILLGFEGLIEN